MDCEHCQETLLDLAYGELDADAAKQSREHLRGCADCRSAFEKLQRGMQLARELPRAEVPKQVGARLMALAEAKVAAASPVTPRKPDASPGFFRPLIELVSRLATGPQVGMVTLTVLIAVVGLLALPQLRAPSPMATATEAVAPGPAAAPVAPEELENGSKLAERDVQADSAGEEKVARAEPLYAPQADEVRSKDELARFAKSSRAAHASAASATRPERVAKAGIPAKPAGPVSDLFAADDKAPAEKKAQAEDAFAQQPAQQNAASGAGVAQRQASYDLLDGALAGAAPASRADKRDQPTAAAAPAPSAARFLTSPEQYAPAPQQAATSQATSSLGKAKQAGSPTNRVDCDSARTGYERTIATAPGTAEAGKAMIELALCARRRGDEAGARALLQRASQIAAVSARARTLLGQASPAPAVLPAAAPAGERQQAPAP